MKVSSIKSRVFIILFTVSLIPMVAFLTIAYLSAFFTGETADFLKTYSLIIALVGVGLFFVSWYYIQKFISTLLGQFKKGMMAVESGDYDAEIEFSDVEEFNEIKDTYSKMTDKLKENKRELELQALEIYAKNIEIQQANMELEASYGQLQATINQLNDSEQKYYSLVKNITDIVCVIRLDGSIFFINDITKEILGFSKQEVEGRNIKEFLKPEMSDSFLGKVSHDLKNRSTLTLEMELMHKSGKLVLTEATLTNFVYDGEIIGIQAIIRDITQKKKLEDEIIASYKEVATINNLSRKMNASLDINMVLKLVVEEICKVLKSPFSVIRLLDDEEGALVPKAYAGEYLGGTIQDVEDLTLHNKDNPAYNNLFGTADTVIIHDFSFSKAVCAINANKQPNEQIKELLMALIKTKEKDIGILTIGTTTKFNSRQKSLLSSVANNAAIAIENARLFELSKTNFIKTVNALIAAIEAKDNYTRGHSYRVSRYAVVIAEKMGLSKKKVDEVRIAGILHDIGKIGVPDAILRKPSRLTDEEFEMVKKHPSISSKILEPVGLSDEVLNAIACHHERWDGRGYPYGLDKSKISIEAQIISVADALDAMISTRAYRNAMTEEEAIQEILKCKDTQFSPEVVEVLFQIIERDKDFLKNTFEQ